MNIKRRTGTVLWALICLSLIFSAFLPAEASAEGEIGKLLATISSEPVALVEKNSISAATSTEGCYIQSIEWFDVNENPIGDYFQAEDCRVEIQVCAGDGYYFAESPEVYLNNKAAGFLRSTDGKLIIIQQVFTPLLWEPTVIKHPGGETVSEGGWASFVATAMYCNDFQWSFISPQGKSLGIEETKSEFPGLTVDGNGSGKIVVHNIPLEMNGWKTACTFSGPGGSVTSNGALIKVEPDKNKPSPEPPAQPEKSPEQESGEEEPEQQEPQDENHVHQYGQDWHSDEQCHWLECECGEKGIIEYHDFQWVMTEKPTRRHPGIEKGRCSVCGYETEREVPYDAQQHGSGGGGALKWILIAAAVLILCGGGFYAYVYIKAARSQTGKHSK